MSNTLCRQCNKIKERRGKLCSVCYSKNYRLLHPFIHRKYHWRKDHPEQYKMSTYNRLNKIESKLMNIIGGYICSTCGYKENKLAIQIAHKNHDGNLDRLRFKTKIQLCYYYIKNELEAKEKLKSLCANCNTIEERNRSRKR